VLTHVPMVAMVHVRSQLVVTSPQQRPPTTTVTPILQVLAKARTVSTPVKVLMLVAMTQVCEGANLGDSTGYYD
jgi:hypothetical protein